MQNADFIQTLIFFRSALRENKDEWLKHIVSGLQMFTDISVCNVVFMKFRCKAPLSP